MLSRKDRITPNAKAVLKKLGENIKIARKRRSLSQAEMASRMFVSQQTLIRLEAGDPGVSLHVLVNALHILGMDNTLMSVASPESDSLGLSLEKQRLPVKIRKKTKKEIDLDF